MPRIKIEFEIEMPIASDADLDEFLRYRMNANGSMKLANPLIDMMTPEPIIGTFKWDWIS